MIKIPSATLRKIEKRLKVKIIKELGKGSGGVVFDVGNNKALKITKNPEEAWGSRKLVGKSLKNVCNTFDVFKIKYNNEDNIYIIVMEKLSKMDKKDDWDELYDYLRSGPILDWPYDITKIVKSSDNEEDTKEIISKMTQEELSFAAWLNHIKNWKDVGLEFAKIARKIKKNQKQFNDLINGYKELENCGVDNRDIHNENIMKRNNDFVIVDVSDDRNINIPLMENKNLNESTVHYAITPETKFRGLRNIERDDWSGMLVFKGVKEGDTFVGKDCLFDIRIAFLDMHFKVLSVGILKKDTGLIIAPRDTEMAVETAADEHYEFIQGTIFPIPAKKQYGAAFMSHLVYP